MVYGGSCKKRSTVALGRVKFPSKKIRATDPCYEKNIWCATTIPVDDEDWGAWIIASDEGEWGTRTARLVLTRPGQEPKGLGEQFLWDCRFRGKKSDPVCGVDSGQFGFFDADQYPGRDDNELWYDSVCQQTLDTPNRAGLCQHGVVTSSGFGDGGYPVYVRREGGKIVEITAVFIEPEDDSESVGEEE